MSVPPLLRQFRLLFGGRRAERELDAEMREHLELLETQYREQGLDPREARRRARMEFGSQEPLRADAREARGLVRTRELTRDLLFGVRVLVRRPGFPAVALLTLGVGVGGAAAIYGATEGILLSPLPYAEPDRLVAAWQLDHASGERQEVSPANFLDWRERATAFEALTAVEPYGFDWLSPEDGPIALETGLVYEGFFDVFRAPPLFGRTFLPEENQPGRGNVAILGYGLWRSRFGGDPDIVGRVVTFDGEPYTIVGVMREDFAVPSNEVVWAPKVLQGWEERSRTSNFYAVFGRLAPGVGLGQAAADLDGVAAALAVAYPTANASIGAALIPLHDQIVGGIRSALWLLLGAVILVLVVVVASVASLQLARAVGRTPEFTLRTALGAGPGRIARHLAVENLLLGAAGAVVSFLAARVMLDGIRALAPADLPRIAEIRADGDVLGFAAAVSLLAVLATGLAPVLLAANPGLQRALGPGGRGQTASPLLRRALAALVVVQVSLTFVLLVGSGLLLRSFVAVVSQPTGFRSDGVAAVTVHTWSYLDGGPARAGFARDVVERLSGMPGITAAGVASGIPLMEAIGADFAPLTLPGAPLRADQNPPLVRFTVVSPGLLDTLGIPLRSGRPFDSRDRADSLPVTLVNERFVDRYLPDREPVGRRISLGGSLATNGEPLNPEIVGVVGDVRNVALHEAPAPAVYLVHPQVPTGANAFIARGVGSADVVLSQVRRAIAEVHASIPIHGETTMEALVAASVRERRFVLVLLGGFAALALSLASAGIFGLMAFVTAGRAKEYGIRRALGAERAELLTLVLRRGLALAGAGILIGVATAVPAAGLVEGLLFEVAPLDLRVFGLAGLTLAAAGAAAVLVPALRAARASPVEVLRVE
ncbi:MAG: ABC transporter permease [Acidobacteria bacterium]|nr:ABC transporter permease [Acidobacteriota bacterium]MYA46196.1 ABC transporter permease [Acidobacteriota bacterium]